MSINVVPSANVPNSGRLSTVNRPQKSPPGAPSPVGKMGGDSSGTSFPSNGPSAPDSPSSGLPARSVMLSETNSVYRSSGNGASKVSSTVPVPGSAPGVKTADTMAM